MSAGTVHASVGRRFVAEVIDETIAVLVFAAGYAVMIVGLLEQSSALLLGGLALFGVLGIGYTVFYIVHQGRTGGTPGKRMLGLRTVDQETLLPIGVGRNFVRQLMLGIFGPLNVIQLFLIGRHPLRQGWHDRIARSVVVPVAEVGGSTVVPEKRVLPTHGAKTPAPLVAPPTTANLASGAPLAPAAAVPPPAAPVAPVAPAPRSSSRRAAPPVITPSAPPVAASVPVGMVAPPPGATARPAESAPPVPAAPPAAAVAPAAPPAPPAPAATPAPPAPQVVAAPSTVLVTATGERHQVVGEVLVGRDPDAGLVNGATVWAVVDNSLTVSKTHALLGLDAGTVWIEDWHSTNGVALLRSGSERALAPHDRTPLMSGDVVLLGDFRITLTGSDA